MSKINWKSVEIQAYSFTCGYCGESVAPNKGWWGKNANGERIGSIYVCHFCYKPTFLDNDWNQYPGVAFGEYVKGIGDSKIEQLYAESRNAMSVNSYTLAVTGCRILLLHIAISQGAKKGLSFIKCVNYLVEKQLIPKESISWVDHIRDKGNEANHDLTICTKKEAETTLKFMQMVLKIIYEYPSDIKPEPEENTESEEVIGTPKT